MPANSIERQSISVTCPACGAGHVARVPHGVEDRTPVVRAHRALFGEFTREECPDGHRFFLYYC